MQTLYLVNVFLYVFNVLMPQCFKLAETSLHIWFACIMHEILFSSEPPDQVNAFDPVSSPSQPSVQVPSSGLSQTRLKDVRTLDMLVQAHTLLAVMEARVSIKHQQYLLQAHEYVVQIWQVSDSVFTVTFNNCCSANNLV